MMTTSSQDKNVSQVCPNLTGNRVKNGQNRQKKGKIDEN
jgi:hypothetical protein